MLGHFLLINAPTTPPNNRKRKAPKPRAGMKIMNRRWRASIAAAAIRGDISSSSLLSSHRRNLMSVLIISAMIFYVAFAISFINKFTEQNRQNNRKIQGQQSFKQNDVPSKTPQKTIQPKDSDSPPAPTAANDNPSRRLTHILETRFMQQQPDLVELAQARLQLFKAVCLPTTVNQSAWGNFIWMIRTDPELDPIIRKELIDMLREANALKKTIVDKNGNALEKSVTFVIGSNYNFAAGKMHQNAIYDARKMIAKALAEPNQIFAGKPDDMRTILDEMPLDWTENDLILWTRLDADDGLRLNFMEYAQIKVSQYFFPDNNNVSTNYIAPKWFILCADQYVGWFLTDPIQQPEYRNGTTYSQKRTFCHTPGLTLVIRGDFDPGQVPRLLHHEIIKDLDGAGGKPCGRKGKLSINDDGKCYYVFDRDHFFTLRSRTPTSNSMDHLTPEAREVKEKKWEQPLVWHSLRRDFGIEDEDLIETNAYFSSHLFEIAEENARSNCRPGYSCKTQRKDDLQRYIDQKPERGAGFDVFDGNIVRT